MPPESLGFRANLFSVQIIFSNQGSNTFITVWYVFTPAYAEIHQRERREGQQSRRQRRPPLGPANFKFKTQRRSRASQTLANF